MILTTDEIIRLSRQGITVRIQRNNEVKCSHYGAERWYPMAYLKRRARPSLMDRIRNFLTGAVA